MGRIHITYYGDCWSDGQWNDDDDTASLEFRVSYEGSKEGGGGGGGGEDAEGSKDAGKLAGDKTRWSQVTGDAVGCLLGQQGRQAATQRPTSKSGHPSRKSTGFSGWKGRPNPRADPPPRGHFFAVHGSDDRMAFRFTSPFSSSGNNATTETLLISV
ncbi:hypothetical protein BHM03_00057191 [Ensete ventricosum]|nr:hypothetical protein BHM03_00057191 [Ensete ventricosum]